MTWATSVPILVFLDLSFLDLDSMYATDRQTDVRQHHRFMPRLLGAGHNNEYKQTVLLVTDTPSAGLLKKRLLQSFRFDKNIRSKSDEARMQYTRSFLFFFLFRFFQHCLFVCRLRGRATVKFLAHINIIQSLF